MEEGRLEMGCIGFEGLGEFCHLLASGFAVSLRGVSLLFTCSKRSRCCLPRDFCFSFKFWMQRLKG